MRRAAILLLIPLLAGCYGVRPSEGAGQVAPTAQTRRVDAAARWRRASIRRA
ncbi:MAG: hypothetical protein HQL38_18560, partial [Alphaproteobacteria bacterium]|nr:hypothetical protein [Alphaproteobacteria bacterium]